MAVFGVVNYITVGRVLWLPPLSLTHKTNAECMIYTYQPATTPSYLLRLKTNYKSFST